MGSHPAQEISLLELGGYRHKLVVCRYHRLQEHAAVLRCENIPKFQLEGRLVPPPPGRADPSMSDGRFDRASCRQESCLDVSIKSSSQPERMITNLDSIRCPHFPN